MYITFAFTITVMLTVSAWAGAQELDPLSDPSPVAAPAIADPAPVEVPEEEPAPVVEPAPAAPEPVIEPAPVVEPAPADPEPVVEPAPVVDPVPVEEPAPVTDDGAGDAIVPPVEPVVPSAPEEPNTTQPEKDVNPVEAEEDPAETSGNDPGGEIPTETLVPITETATETETPMETATATESPTPSPTVAPATPSPTVEPSPTPEPTPVITWSQPNPINCVIQAGNAQSLALGDNATWRCQTSVAADITGDAPEDLHVLWQIGAGYAGDDVQISLPSGSLASVLTPDPNPGGQSELVTYRTNWADGQKLTFDVTVTRTSCVVGEAGLKLNAGIDLKTADATVQIVRSGENPVDTQLASAATANLAPPTVSMQRVNFGTMEWNGESWGTAYATTHVTVSNDQPCATSQAHLVRVQVVASDPGMGPMISSVSVPEGALTSVAVGDTNAAAVGIAYVPAGFEGTAQVEIVFELSPTLEVDAGEHSFGFRVTALPSR